jgi:hypothetical protein
MLDHSCQTQRHKLSERGHDLYETPAVAVETLLRVERIPHRIWEPACGPGAITRVLRANKHHVVASDLVDYKSPDQDYSGWDFLLTNTLTFEVDCILTNPPFKLANEFVAKAIELCPRVYMLLRLAFMESERRTPILDSGNLCRVHVFRKRLPMMHRAGWEGRKANSGMAFAWFTFIRGYHGPIELRRVSWEREG